MATGPVIELSLNEVEATITKAARGRGVDHGVAIEIGAAARWLCERGLDGIGAAHRVLVSPSASRSGVGATELALATGEPIDLEGIASPLLLSGLAGRIGWWVDQNGRLQQLDEPTAPKGQTVTASTLWPDIEAWAAHTYVPSSERSLTSGAGAGLTDND